MPIDNPTLCCLMGVCCQPKQQAQALSSFLATALARTENDPPTDYAAQVLLDNFDLVPKGVGAAIVEGYRGPFLESPTAPISIP